MVSRYRKFLASDEFRQCRNPSMRLLDTTSSCQHNIVGPGYPLSMIAQTCGKLRRVV